MKKKTKEMTKELEFYYAVIENDIKKLLEMIHDEDGFCENIKPYNESLLYHAAVNGKMEMVELLLKKGCDPDAKNEKGYTPLHAAALYGFTRVVEILLKNKAEVNTQDVYGNTPLQEAVSNYKNDMDIIVLLIKNGANPLIRNHNGMSPFQLARVLNNEKAIQYFESTQIKN